jgi:hypothetical protein
MVAIVTLWPTGIYYVVWEFPRLLFLLALSYSPHSLPSSFAARLANVPIISVFDYASALV